MLYATLPAWCHLEHRIRLTPITSDPHGFTYTDTEVVDVLAIENVLVCRADGRYASSTSHTDDVATSVFYFGTFARPGSELHSSVVCS